MEDGAILEGNCMMINAKEALEKRLAEANAPRAVIEPAFEESETPVYLEVGEEERAETATN